MTLRSTDSAAMSHVRPSSHVRIQVPAVRSQAQPNSHRYTPDPSARSRSTPPPGAPARAPAPAPTTSPLVLVLALLRKRHVTTRAAGASLSSLDLVEVDVAGELHWGEVHDADGAAGVGDLEAHAQRVELAVVGEDLKGLLGVVGGVEELDPGVELSAVGVEDDLELLSVGVDGEGAQSSCAVDALARPLRELRGDSCHGARGVVGGGAEGELVLACVADLDHGLLVAGADKGLDGAQLPVLAVGLKREGGPVGSKPELDVRVDGATLAGHRHLHTILREVLERPGLAGLALDPLRKTTVGGDLFHAPLGHALDRGQAEGGHARKLGHARGEGNAALQGGKREESSGELHLNH